MKSGPPSDTQVLICVPDRENVEALQSAEILGRDLRHHGVRVHLDARQLGETGLTVTLDDACLREGEVDLRLRENHRRVKLEEAVDAIVALLKKGKP